MRTLMIGLALAAFAVGGARAQDRLLPVGDLLGKGPDEVAAQVGLTGGPAWTPLLGAVDQGRQIALVRADTWAYRDCDGLVDFRSPDGATYVDAFLFEDGRLTGVILPRPYRSSQPLTTAERRADLKAAAKRPAGPLPVATGLRRHVEDLKARAVPANASFRIRCRPRIAPETPRPAPAATSLLAAPFGLAILAWFSPYIAVEKLDAVDRKATAQRGAALAADLRLGEAPPGGVAAFRKHKDVRWYEDAPGYAVAVVDLGGGRKGARNSTMAGVREGVVEWIGSPNGAAGLCSDPEGRTSAARRGCTTTGHYSPDRD
jgi:hypothetical protein